MTPELTGALYLALILIIACAVLFWPQPKPRPDAATLLQSERNRFRSSAARIADAEDLPDGMTPALLDLADRLALDVHEGRRTVASAIAHMSATARTWTREMREAGAAGTLRGRGPSSD